MSSYLVAVCDLVLAVEVVPDVNHAVHPRDEENSCPRRAKAPARKICAMVLQLDNEQAVNGDVRVGVAAILTKSPFDPVGVTRATQWRFTTYVWPKQ